MLAVGSAITKNHKVKIIITVRFVISVMRQFDQKIETCKDVRRLQDFPMAAKAVALFLRRHEVDSICFYLNLCEFLIRLM